MINRFQIKTNLVDTNTILITSKSKYDDVGIVEVSQAGSSSACLTTDLTLPPNSLHTSTANVDASCFVIHSEVELTAENESLVGHGDGGEMIQSAKDEINMAKDPWLWLDFSADDLAYWNACGSSDCQHHNRTFDKSYRHFSSRKSVRYCLPKLFWGQNPMVRNTRESSYCIHHQQDHIVLFVNCLLLNISHILLQEKQ